MKNLKKVFTILKRLVKSVNAYNGYSSIAHADNEIMKACLAIHKIYTSDDKTIDFVDVNDFCDYMEGREK